MLEKQGRRRLACAALAAVLLWPPHAVVAGGAPAVTNWPVFMRPPHAAPQSKIYFGSRIEPVATAAAPQNPYEANYTSVLRSYYKAIIGFRLALTARAYLFIGVGMAVPGDLLEQGLGQNISITAAQIQDALGMQTEYGLGWDF